jgi:hypothetical protein
MPAFAGTTMPRLRGKPAPEQDVHTHLFAALRHDILAVLR